jgi:hypothetical protein
MSTGTLPLLARVAPPRDAYNWTVNVTELDFAGVESCNSDNDP